MMSAGLTFGLIPTTFGLSNGLINQSQYSILTAVLVVSAITPSLIAEWKFPITNN
ncbi:MAG: hypothetical protein LBM96_02685 [Methanobrevibacter sp.]|jgi:Kef-type K+ transport system membrane component KefB|nr:hypothetical protein [Candidatus Methanoflexus mossambicus]